MNDIRVLNENIDEKTVDIDYSNTIKLPTVIEGCDEVDYTITASIYFEDNEAFCDGFDDASLRIAPIDPTLELSEEAITEIKNIVYDLIADNKEEIMSNITSQAEIQRSSDRADEIESQFENQISEYLLDDDF